MKTINLIDINKSDVKYERTVFPDGEPHIKLDDIDRKDNYRVICRISSPNELFIVLQVGHILKRQGVLYDLIITYLMSMRMDRVVNFNEDFTLELVGNMINTCEAEHVYIFEAHSERTFKVIHNSEPAYLLNELTVNASRNEYQNFVHDVLKNYETNAICFPDHGAQSRYGSTFDGAQTLCMNKVRDLEHKGIIKSMEIESDTELTDNIKSITIVDDLCDGGGTFCWAASILREKYGKDMKLNIFVKHLVNPVGLKKLSETFDNVYITNSFKDWKDDAPANVHVFNVA